MSFTCFSTSDCETRSSQLSLCDDLALSGVTHPLILKQYRSLTIIIDLTEVLLKLPMGRIRPCMMPYRPTHLQKLCQRFMTWPEGCHSDYSSSKLHVRWSLRHGPGSLISVLLPTAVLRFTFLQPMAKGNRNLVMVIMCILGDTFDLA